MATINEIEDHMRREALRRAIAAFPDDQRETRIADALKEIAESDRRAAVMEQVAKLSTDEIERRFG
jgi:hypothetical protein